MKTPVFPRFVGIFFLYLAVFVLLVSAQFARQRGFTLRIANMVVSGHYGDAAEAPREEPDPDERPLSGGVSVFFGGMEFRFTGDDGADFGLIGPGGERSAAVPATLRATDTGVIFRFAEGTELSFTLQNGGARNDGAQELRITGSFGGDNTGIEFPYRLMRSSRIRDAGDGQFIVVSEGISYSFGRSSMDSSRHLLILEAGGAAISYRAIPEKKNFIPEEFAIPPAENRQRYRDDLAAWRINTYARFNRNPGILADEAEAAVYLGEAVWRGGYRTAVTSLPSALKDISRRSFVSAAYLGRLDIGFRTLAAYEGEQFALLSRLTKERSPEFLKMPHVFEYAGIRGYGNVINDGAETVRSIDPSTLSADLIPSILEGLINWKLFRPHGENPFERLIDEALSAVSEGIRRTPDGEGVFFFFNSQADTEYNLRLGIALDLYGEQADRPGWAVLGRSVVLSVLALDDSAVPARLSLSGGGEITATPGEPLSAARICRLLFPNSYPRAVGIGAGVNGIWSWTAATALEVSQENNVLDISVSFPAGETHYMMIRGLKPFTKIQLYNIDYRTDPQFERYDSSGWSYSQEDQTLLLKMKHRDTVEHIRIFY